MADIVIPMKGYVVRGSKIAQGGMAEVFQAKWISSLGMERPVALKRILSEYGESLAYQNMFRSEAKVMTALVHANIVQVLDCFEEEGNWYIMLEYILGRNLRQILKRAENAHPRFPIPMALYCMAEVAEGLAYAHQKIMDGRHVGIVHRDINPQNIMVSGEGAIKIIDFGVAKLRNAVEKTATGVLKGKLGYMSPEQVEGLVVDGRSDIFSLGVVLYEMLTGQRLFSADTEIRFVKLMENYQLPNIIPWRPDVTPELERVVTHAIEKDRSYRYPTAQAFSDDVQKILITQYGGYSATTCANFMQALFGQELMEEQTMLARPISVLRSPEKQAMSHHVNWHEVSPIQGVRVKIALDDGRPWKDAKVVSIPKKVAPPKPVSPAPPKPTLPKRWWQDPKKRRLILIIAFGLLAIWWAWQQRKDSALPESTEQEISVPQSNEINGK